MHDQILRRLIIISSTKQPVE